MEFEAQIDNECSFATTSKVVCSPAEVVDKLKAMTQTIAAGTAIRDEKHALDLLKNKYGCQSESCVLTKDEVKQSLGAATVTKALRENFKPKGPRNTTDWLSNTDIDDVLKQIARKFPLGSKNAFLHVPYQMRDFEQTKSELASLDFPAEYARGYRTFGTVVNTDSSAGDGIHWFALFGDFRTDSPTIEYFNSSGEMPLIEIQAWMQFAKTAWSSKMKKTIATVVVSRVQMQYDTHSCGVYSLYYIMSRLNDVPSTYFSSNRVPDELMHDFRRFLFRDER